MSNESESISEEISRLVTREDQLENLGIVTSPLVEVARDFKGTYETSAPVKIPDREELTVRLVNINLLQRLDELRSDVTLMQTIFWTIVGGCIGFAINIVTSSQSMDKASWTLLTVLAAFGTTFGFLTWRARERAVFLRRKIFDEKPK